jgi:amidase
MSVKNIQERLQKGEVTSVELVEQSLRNHEQWIDKNSIAVISPYAMKQAIERDRERALGKIRGPLHGIPILIKDNILYKDGTPTTANAFALHDFIPPHHATLVENLIASGAIILGKANLSEFAYFMSYDDMPSGFGSMYGQVKHPFDEKIDPLGSSTGSAVAVKLGIVDLAIGSETNGSLMAPAYQCQIVSVKPSFGYVSKHGIIPISPTQDCAGPMAQTVEDCAYLLDAIAKEDEHDQDTSQLPRPKSFTDRLYEPLEPQKIGFLSIKGHTYAESELHLLSVAEERLISLGHQVIHLEIEQAHIPNDPTLLIEFKHALNHFLEQFKGSTKMTSLHDIIEFNKANERRCLRYGQSILTASEQTCGELKDPSYISMRRELVEKASLLEKLMKEHDLISIAAPLWLGFAPIYGNPSVCIPEGVFEGVPKAMVFIGKKYDDASLIRLTHQYQQLE